MEENSQDNLTTRSLLKGIIATETVRTAVKHKTKRSTPRKSVSRLHQDNIPASPSMTLRNQMKARVRKSVGKLALEDSSVKKLHTKKKPANEGFQNIVDELNKITPQTLLKKIIQNEDEVSILASQRSKTAVEHTEQEENREPGGSSLSDLNLSLSDQQDTERLDVFRISRKKRRMNSSQFEREVDEKLPKNIGDSSNLKESFEALTSLSNTNVKSRSFGSHLDFSIEPQSTYKRALLRKPNKAFLVSLGDFEQGVEDKYHLIKGSQECFIESTVEDKSSVSTRGVAELNTELYVPPLPSELSNFSSEKRLPTSSSLSSIDKKKHGTSDLSLQAKIVNISVNIPPKDVLPDIPTTEMMEEATKPSERTSNILNSVLLGEDVEHSGANQSMQKSLAVGENGNVFESDHSIYKSKSAVKNISYFGSEEKKSTKKSVSMIEDDKNSERKGILKNSALLLENDGSFQLHQNFSNSPLIDKYDRSIKAYLKTQKPELVILETADGVEHEPIHAVLAETEKKHEVNRLSGNINNSEFIKENGNQYTKTLNISSRHEDNSESSQGHNSENLLHKESTMEDEVASPEYHARMNKQSMNSVLIETPTYIRNARLKIPTNKPIAGKKVQKKTILRKEKVGSAFKSSLVKQLFSLHAKMRLSKGASTDVEELLEMFLDQMTGDLAAYTAHANRKTITLADLELLMKRQRLVTDATSLNVLIEKHLPMECRKLLISCATSGNQVFPKM
ncbi:centromere protein T isoform 2-T2 [Mantella aurantiaca]